MPTSNLLTRPTHIVEDHLLGVKKRIGEAFLMQEPVLTFSNNPIGDFLRRANNQQDNPNIQYPFVYIKPRGVQIKTDGYSPRRLAKSKYTAFTRSIPTDEDHYIELRFIPVTYNLEIGYMHDDALEFLRFASDWMYAAASSDLNFRLRHMGIGLDIQVELSESWDIPDQDRSGDTVTQSVGISQVVVHGYTTRSATEVKTHPVLNKVNVSIGAGAIPNDPLNPYLVGNLVPVDSLPTNRPSVYPGSNISNIMNK